MLPEKVMVTKLQEKCDPIVNNCWDLDPPITKSEIENDVYHGALSSPDIHPKPTIRSEHISLIAWFVVHGWIDPIQIDVGVPSLGCYPKWPLEDGNHRFAAAIIRGDTTIDAHMSGEVDLCRTFCL